MYLYALMNINVIIIEVLLSIPYTIKIFWILGNLTV